MPVTPAHTIQVSAALLYAPLASPHLDGAIRRPLHLSVRPGPWVVTVRPKRTYKLRVSMLFLQDVHRTASLISGNERERNLSRGQGRGVTFVAYQTGPPHVVDKSCADNWTCWRHCRHHVQNCPEVRSISNEIHGMKSPRDLPNWQNYWSRNMYIECFYTDFSLEPKIVFNSPYRCKRSR